MSPALEAALEAALGSRVLRLVPTHGGDVDRAFRAELAGGVFFVKAARDGRRDRMDAEARGLGWLAVPAVIGVPRPIAVLADPAALVLPWIERGPATPASDERLGRALAALHRAGAPTFGAADDGFLATLPLENGPLPTWAAFYGERRLVPLAHAAEARGAVDASLRRRVESLASRLADRAPEEPPARLHGDLWGGNAMVDSAGAPHVFDPSAFGGHREIDLAMMQLFGGFSSRVFSAYDEVFPRAPGHEARVPLFQLLPLLAHAVLFGGTWSRGVRAALDALGA